MPTYAKRKIDVTINLAEGQFGDDKGSDVTLSGLRVSANIAMYNGDAQGQLQLRVFGLPLAMINQLTNVAWIMRQRRNNRITLTAGDEGGAMSTVYEGTIDSAFGDFNGAPEVVFNVVALSSAFDAVKIIPPSAYKGPFDAADALSNLAKIMGPQPDGLVFENNGVSVMLQDRTYNGEALSQVKEIAKEANIYYTINCGKLAIWPKTGFRVGEPVKVSAATGMVGYPSFSGDGIIIAMLFNPDIAPGGRVVVTSDLTVACGVWDVFKVAHVLESETPNGQWFTQIECGRMSNV